MECFEDRSHAGHAVAELLTSYRARPDVLVLGLPRGGVPLAVEVSTSLGAPLDVMVVQKIAAPGAPEFVLGALAPGGVVALNEDAINLCVDTPEFRSEAIRAGLEMRRRESLYRGIRSPLILSRRTAILVDDGAATGASMRAAIRAARMLGAHRVVVALGVVPKELLPTLRVEANEVICAKVAQFFCSVAQYYRQFGHVSDEEITARLHPSPVTNYHRVPS